MKIITCNECKNYRKPIEYGDAAYCHIDGRAEMQRDDYCSWAEAKEEMKFEVKFDMDSPNGLEDLLKECEEASRNGLIDGTTKLYLKVEDKQIVYEPRQTAKWIIFKNGSGECSNCHRRFKPITNYDGEFFKYCNHCGAEMYG